MKDVETAVYEVRKSCQAIKNSTRAQPTPIKTADKGQNRDEDSDAIEEIEPIQKSSFMTSTPERKQEKEEEPMIEPIFGSRNAGHTSPKKLASGDIKLSYFPSGFQPASERKANVHDEIETVIDQSFNRILDKTVGRRPVPKDVRNPNMTK